MAVDVHHVMATTGGLNFVPRSTKSASCARASAAATADAVMSASLRCTVDPIRVSTKADWTATTNSHEYCSGISSERFRTQLRAYSPDPRHRLIVEGFVVAYILL